MFYVWLDGVTVTVIERSPDRLRPGALSDSDFGQVVHTHVVPLFTKQYNWYQSKGCDPPRLGR